MTDRIQAELEAAVSAARATTSAFPRTTWGLHSDEVKASPEWKAARLQYDRAFEALRRYNRMRSHMSTTTSED